MEYRMQQRVRREDEDILLRLPRNVLSKILSLLSTKDAVRTSVVSKNWEYIWTCIYNMNFDDKQSNKEDFANFVERALSHSDTTSKLENFTLRLTRNYGPRVSTWISAAVYRNVESLELVARYRRGTNPVLLPRCLYEHSSLKEFTAAFPMTLRGFCYGFLENLKVLKLSNITIENPRATATRDGIARQTLTFSALEVFEMLHCQWNNYVGIDIEAPSLVDFRMGFSSFHVLGVGFYRLEFRIISPHLERFEYEGGQYLENFILPSPPLVTIATYKLHFGGPISYMHVQANRILSLTTILRRLKCLHLSLEVIMVLDNTQRLLELPTMDTVIRVTVSSDHLRMSAVLLLRFLQNTPNVDTLTLAMGRCLMTEETYDQLPVPSCLHDTLKQIRLEYSDHYKFRSSDYQLLKYFVINSASLSKIEVDSNGNKRLPKRMIENMLEKKPDFLASMGK